MNKTKKWIFLSLFALLCQGVQAQTPKTPEQVLDWYLKIFINHDAESAIEYNDYARSLFGGKDPLNVDKIKALPSNIKEFVTQGLLEGLPEETKAALKEDAEKLSQKMVQVISSSQCRATGHTLKNNEWVQGQKIAEVTYVCMVADVNSKRISTDEFKGKTPIPVDKLRQALQGMTSSLDQVEMTKKIEKKIDLYNSEDKTLWYNGSPSSLVGQIMQEQLQKN